MAKEKPAEHDESLVQSAALRASIIGWLNQNEGTHRIREIAEGLGADHEMVRRSCKTLLASEQIGAEGGGGRGNILRYYAIGGETSEKPVRKAKTTRTGVKDVELVVAGVEIVIGRNPATGRLRITLES